MRLYSLQLPIEMWKLYVQLAKLLGLSHAARHHIHLGGQPLPSVLNNFRLLISAWN